MKTFQKYFLSCLLALAPFAAEAGGPGPAPYNFNTSQIFDASSSPTTPNYLTIDANGAAKIAGTVTTTPSSPATASGAITSTQSVCLSALPNVSTVGVDVAGTWTGTVIAQTQDANAVATTIPVSNRTTSAHPSSITANGSFVAQTAGATNFCVVGATVGSGSATVTLRANTAAQGSIDAISALAGTAGTPSAAVVTVQGSAAVNSAITGAPIRNGGSDGTNIQDMGVVVGDTGQNSQVVAGARKEVSFTTTTAQAVASTDVSNYRYVSVHIVTQGGSSTVTFQSSNDNTNWVSTGLLTAASIGASAPVTSTTSAGVIMHGPVTGRYFRLNVTGIVSGTTAGVTEFFSTPPPIVATGGVATVFGNSASGAADSGSPVKIAGVFNTTQPTVTTAQRVDTQSTNRGALIVATGVDAFSTNLAQVNGTTALTGTGAQGAGAQRVTVATDSATVAGSASLPAGSNVIGHVIADSGSTTAVTGTVSTQQTAPAAAAILAGRQTFTATTGATTLITIPAGKTFTGQITASVSCQTVAATATACQANATFTTVGANSTPAAGTYFVCDAKGGANAATGTVGSQSANFCSIPVIANCSSGTCTIAVASTNAGTASLTEASAWGFTQ